MMQDILTKEESLGLYRKLVLARFCEEKICQEYFKDEMKTPVHLGIGGEGIPIGVHHCLPPSTKAFGTYRNHSLYLAMTEDTDGFFGELYGKRNGPAKGKAGSMHLSLPEKNFVATSAVVGTTVPLALGAAFANTYRGSDDVVTVFFGDGAVEEGAFWESINFAALRRLKILFVCEDNGLAIHTHARQRRGFKSLLNIVEAFDFYKGSGDGSDLTEVIRVTRQVTRQMQDKPGPALLNFTYHRFLEHVGPREDFDAGYRQKPEPEDIKRLDPVLRFEEELKESGLQAQALEAIRCEVQEKIDRSVKTAQQAPFPPPEELFADVLI
ncbi:MAG: thiamine pyrophosphate-dependent dehydrogenase E1 component subunit alpha [Deltaproteobacteria bacterium]|nr:thiamine pyrophosphate-dependent dehydrogenase E1 component subunit alpha [Deltaproteobacteria bacterium]MDZ4224572.1 thiamine pyrophosphate-dependent dehydrogenase E1 component subunit alpha [bacterium]